MRKTDRETLLYVNRLLEQGKQEGNFRFWPYVEAAQKLLATLATEEKRRTLQQKKRLQLVTEGYESKK